MISLERGKESHVNGRILFSTMLVMLLALAGCGQQGADPPVEQPVAEAAAGEAEEPQNEAWEAMLAELRAVETDEEKVPILKAFIDNHPNDENAAHALSGVIYYLGDAPEEKQEALAYSRKTLAAVTEPDVRREMQLELLSLYGSLGNSDALFAAAQEMAKSEPLNFAENDRITEAALEAGAWQLALSHAQAAGHQIHPDTFRADFPDREFTDEEVDKAVKQRRATALAGQGWAMARLGQLDDAVDAFENGSSSVTRNYVGIPDGPLYSYWGRTLAELGRHEKAMALLAPAAILGGDEEAMDALHGAFTAAHGEKGFEDYLKKTRNSMAVQMDDFTLNNYQGEPLTLSQLKGQVVLLSFWFPT
jgi:tetratricopeptide (TPR) repeat protein